MLRWKVTPEDSDYLWVYIHVRYCVGVSERSDCFKILKVIRFLDTFL